MRLSIQAMLGYAYGVPSFSFFTCVKIFCHSDVGISYTLFLTPLFYPPFTDSIVTTHPCTCHCTRVQHMFLDCAECIVVQFLIFQLYRVSVFFSHSTLACGFSFLYSHPVHTWAPLCVSLHLIKFYVLFHRHMSSYFLFFTMHSTCPLSIVHTYGHMVFVPLIPPSISFWFQLFKIPCVLSIT